MDIAPELKREEIHKELAIKRNRDTFSLPSCQRKMAEWVYGWSCKNGGRKARAYMPDESFLCHIWESDFMPKWGEGGGQEGPV